MLRVAPAERRAMPPSYTWSTGFVLVLFLSLEAVLLAGCAKEQPADRLVLLIKKHMTARTYTGRSPEANGELDEISRLYAQQVQARDEKAFLHLLEDAVPMRRVVGVGGLRQIGDVQARRALVGALADESSDVRAAAADALGDLKAVESVADLVHVAGDPALANFYVQHPWANPRRECSGTVASYAIDALVNPDYSRPRV